MQNFSKIHQYLLSLSEEITQTVPLIDKTEQPETTVDILIVDDVLENIRLLSSILADHGYQVLASSCD